MVPPDDREQWQKRSVLTFALVSFALGPSKVVTFPYLIYDNGGGHAQTFPPPPPAVQQPQRREMVSLAERVGV
ncbi:hypothetical protein MTO96_030949 [Rhipicephalus appendiculatus]